MKIPSFVWVALTLIVGVGFILLLVADRNNRIYDSVTLPVQVEVYSDYNCPHCADFVPFVEEAEAELGDDVNIMSKHLPFLADSSYEYAEAAEAARLQGKFNEFNHDLFEWVSYQKDPSNTIYEYSDDEKEFYARDVDVSALASRLGLDLDQFEEDRMSDEIANLVLEQKADVVRRLGTQATPTVFIYGQVFKMNTYDDFKNKLQELISFAKNNEAE